MSLNSASSLEDIKAAYADNASYAEAGSAAMAQQFITACRLLLMHLPKSASHGGMRAESIELNLDVITLQIKDATRYIATHPDPRNIRGRRTSYADFSGFRDNATRDNIPID